MVGKSSIQWIQNVSDFEALHRTDEQICMVDPGNGNVRELWQEVITSQYILDVQEESDNDEGLIFCPEALTLLCQYYAPQLKIKTYQHFSDIQKSLATCSQKRLVIVGFAVQFNTADIAQLTQVSNQLQKEIGFICGRDIAQISFMMAKNTLCIDAHVDSVATFDAPLHRYQPTAAEIEQTIERLRVQTRIKVLRSHGEGSHAKLPGVTVCGLVDEHEFPDVPDAGCSQVNQKCKRAASPDVSVLFANQVRSPVIAFFCCNGFNVSSELFPSPVSMALSFGEAWCGSLITSIRPVIVTQPMITFVQVSLKSGQPLGWVVAELNKISEQLGQRNAFVLMGDPAYSYTTLRDLSCAEKQDFSSLDIVDLNEHLTESKHWLSQVVVRTDRARRLIRTFENWLGDETPAFVEQLSAQLSRLGELTTYLVKRVELCPSGDEYIAFLRAMFPVKTLLRQWDKCLSSHILSLRQNLDPFDAFHYDQMLQTVEYEKSCQRCNSPLESQHFGLGESEESTRIAEMCLVCGPVAEYRKQGLGIEVVSQTKVARPGDIFSLTIRIRQEEQRVQITSAVSVNLRFFDKAMDLCVEDTVRHVSVESELVNFEFQLPEALSCDLHSIRLVAVSGLDFAYCRARLACLPKSIDKPIEDVV